jgi:hypothetical protein
VEIGGAVLSLLGVVVSVYGTYLMTKWYHPYKWAGFVKSVALSVWREIAGEGEKTARHNRVAALMAEMTPENKAESLNGIHWVFFGFLLQAIGALLILGDVVWLNVVAERATQ